MKTRITSMLVICIAVIAMSFTIGSKNAGTVLYTGKILSADGEKIENVRIKIFVDGEYHSYRFIEDGKCEFVLPKQGDVQLHFCHKFSAESCIKVDTKINLKMKGAAVAYDMTLYPKKNLEKMNEIHDFKNSPIASFKVNADGEGVNQIETQTKQIHEQAMEIAAVPAE